MDCLSEKGYCVNCAVRSVDQENGLLSGHFWAPLVLSTKDELVAFSKQIFKEQNYLLL